MFRRATKSVFGLCLAISLSAGCSSAYKGVVKPVADLKGLAPELADLSNERIERALKTDVRPTFPATLAVARLNSTHEGYYYGRNDATADVGHFEALTGDELANWRKLTDLTAPGGGKLIDQVQPVSALLVGHTPTLKGLRDAAAQLHAPLLLVYTQGESWEDGYNDAAMAYWTIVGLFLVPGNTVGHYTTCQGILVDTRTGAILATLEGESKKEENVLAGAVDIAQRRTRLVSRKEAVEHLQTSTSQSLSHLATQAVTSAHDAKQ